MYLYSFNPDSKYQMFKNICYLSLPTNYWTNFMRLQEKALIDKQLPYYSSESKNESFSFFSSPNRRMDMFWFQIETETWIILLSSQSVTPPPPQNKYVFIPLQKEGKCYWNNSYNILSIENWNDYSRSTRIITIPLVKYEHTKHSSRKIRKYE